MNASSIFNGLPPIPVAKRALLAMWYVAEFDYLVDYLVFNGKVYCGECGSPIIIARENEHYTIPTEPCCKSCGLVYQLA